MEWISPVSHILGLTMLSTAHQLCGPVGGSGLCASLAYQASFEDHEAYLEATSSILGLRRRLSQQYSLRMYCCQVHMRM